MSKFHNHALKRRTVLGSLAGGLVVSASGARAADAGPGVDPDGKFGPDGNVRIWAGDTIICPLPFNSPAFAEMLRINVEVTRHFRDFIAATPPASYHMTVYGCADPQRRAAHLWPRGAALDAPIAEIDRLILDRLKQSRFDYSVPIRMRVDPSESFRALTALPLLPADERQRDELYRLRESIAAKIGLWTPNIETFRFHMTYGYQFRSMPADATAALRKAAFGWRRELAARLGVIAFPAPVYCKFQDMFSFDPIFTVKKL